MNYGLNRFLVGYKKIQIKIDNILNLNLMDEKSRRNFYN